MYFIIHREYVGPDQHQYIDTDTYRIQTIPGLTNRSHEPRIIGWLGTTNDWSEYAHGQFDTEQEARDRVSEFCSGQYREFTYTEQHFANFNPDIHENVIAYFKPGAYEPCAYSSEFCWSMRNDITADTTDDQITQIIDQCEAEANKQGLTLFRQQVRQMFEQRRTELIEKAEDE
jgi:hypothetical protein